jgi:hypothetical protein
VLKHHRTGHQMERDLRRHFVAYQPDARARPLGERPLADVDKKTVVDIVDRIVAVGHHSMARNVFGGVRSFFEWVIGRGIYGIDKSPCDRLKPRHVIGKSKTKRSRVLTDEEWFCYWRAAGKMGRPQSTLLRMLALVPNRRDEIGRGRRRELDLTNARSPTAEEIKAGEKRRQIPAPVWTVPAARMKGTNEEARPFAIPPTPTIVAMLDSLPRGNADDFLFSKNSGLSPVNSWSKDKRDLDRLMLRTWRALGRLKGEDRRGRTFPRFVIHDVRRSIRTGLSALPIPHEIREACLAHRKGGVHGIYDLYENLEERRRALQLWEQKLLSIVEPPKGDANVVRGVFKGAS